MSTVEGAHRPAVRPGASGVVLVRPTEVEERSSATAPFPGQWDGLVVERARNPGCFILDARSQRGIGHEVPMVPTGHQRCQGERRPSSSTSASRNIVKSAGGSNTDVSAAGTTASMKSKCVAPVAAATIGRNTPAPEWPTSTVASPAARVAASTNGCHVACGSSNAHRRSGAVASHPRSRSAAASGSVVAGPTSGLWMMHVSIGSVSPPREGGVRPWRDRLPNRYTITPWIAGGRCSAASRS